jgi:outer membrane protein insertion porin family
MNSLRDLKPKRSNSISPIFAFIGTGFAAVAVPSFAEAAVITTVHVIGAERVGVEAVTDNITISPGKSFSEADIDQSIKQLYSTGYFSNVNISIAGQSLLVSVRENDLLNAVVFNGNRQIKQDKLAEMITSRAAHPYSEAQVQTDIKTIKDAYAAIGRNDVQVTTKVVNIAKNRVNLAFVIDEGKRTKIDKISFSGNLAYNDGRLSAVINTKRSNFLSFLTRKDIYSAEKQSADEDALRKFYYDHGYVDFRVLSADATLSEASNTYNINFSLDEGQRYRYGDITVVSTVQGVNADDLKSLIVTRKGDVYNAQDIQKSIEAISKRVEAIPSLM